MIHGVLARRRGPAHQRFDFHNAAVMVITAGARSHSDARVSLVALNAARQARQPSRADVPLLVLAVARTSRQVPRADVPLLVLAVARPAPATLTPIRAERMAVMVVHSAA